MRGNYNLYLLVTSLWSNICGLMSQMSLFWGAILVTTLGYDAPSYNMVKTCGRANLVDVPCPGRLFLISIIYVIILTDHVVDLIVYQLTNWETDFHPQVHSEGSNQLMGSELQHSQWALYLLVYFTSRIWKL